MSDLRKRFPSVRPARFPGMALLASAACGFGATVPAAVRPVALDPVVVLGSRVRATEGVGPSPVLSFDRDDVRATGAMTVADFLRLLPQNYSGISAGRGSVPDELNPDFGRRTETLQPATSLVLGAAAASPGQTGVSGVGLRGLGSGSTLVLLDGRRLPKSGEGNRATDSRQSFVNLNAIPLGMIERIEVLPDGASALYGADAVAGVINLALRRDYTGAELTVRQRSPEQGGGRERQIGLAGGVIRGPFRALLSLEIYDRDPLKASARRFSREQDHRGIRLGTAPDGRPVFGRDLRLNWGYPAVVQAVSGTLAGVAGADGTPARVALVPDGAEGALTPAQFIPGSVILPATVQNATQQRRGNTAAFIDLVPASTRQGASVVFSYRPGPDTEFFGHLVTQTARGVFATQPAVSAASATTGFGNFATVVPAAFNPFGQDVTVGLIHVEFGSVRQVSRLRALNAAAGLRGPLPGDWRWEAGVSWGRDTTGRVTRELNGPAVTAALRHPDPARRLNPFLDARVAGPRQNALYESLATYAHVDSRGEILGLDAVADGTWPIGPGGDLAAAFGGELAVAKSRSLAFTAGGPAGPEVSARRRSQAWFAEFRLPVFGARNARPLLRRFELHGAGRHEEQGRAGATTNPKLGFAWAPHPALVVRGTWSTGFRAPDLTEYGLAETTNQGTLIDPRRAPAATTGVTILRGPNPALRPETSRSRFVGFVFEPPRFPGLTLALGRCATDQHDAIRLPDVEMLVQREQEFPGRVVRAAPDSADLALEQPGRLLAVDGRLLNFGRVRSDSLDCRVEFRAPAGAWGRWRLSVNATRTLAASVEVTPGRMRDERGDTFAPPRWKGLATAAWEKGPWHAALLVHHLGGFNSNAAGNPLATTERYPGQTVVDLRLGREFPQGLWRGYGRRLQLGLGIGNVLDREPPFSDTVFGFNGGLHSPLGRTWEFSAGLPF